MSVIKLPRGDGTWEELKLPGLQSVGNDIQTSTTFDLEFDSTMLWRRIESPFTNKPSDMFQESGHISVYMPYEGFSNTGIQVIYGTMENDTGKIWMRRCDSGVWDIWSLVAGEELETATGEDINTGTDNEKYVTPKSIKDSKLLESSDGSIKDWITVDKTTFDDLALNEQLEEGRVYNVIGDALQATTSTPVGATIIWFGKPDKIPVNYLLCEGQALNKSEYVSLYDKIGDTYGSTETTFNLPNLKGRVVVGHDASQSEFNTLGKTGGSKTHTLTVAQMPNHNHNMSPRVAGGNGDVTGQADYVNVSWATVKYFSNWRSFETGGGQAHNNLQPYITGYYIIKVREEAYTEDLRNLDREVSELKKPSARFFPIGTVLEGESADYNPNNFYVDGVWEVTQQGMVSVGLDASQTEFDTIGKTGGSKFTEKHRHDRISPVNNPDWVLGDSTGLGGVQPAPNVNRFDYDGLDQPGNRSLWSTNYFGTGNSGNLQPYQVVYKWKLVSYE